MDFLMHRYGFMFEQFAALYSGDPALHEQFRGVSVTAEDRDINGAGGHLQLETPVTAMVADRDSVDAMANDADGAMIDVILHFVGGRLRPPA